MTTLVPRLGPVPLSDADVEVLAGLHGAARTMGPARLAQALEPVTAARLHVVTDYVDAYGPGEVGGNFEVVGAVFGSRAVGNHPAGRAVMSPVGPWRRLDPRVWQWLDGADGALHPSELGSVLDYGDDATYEHDLTLAEFAEGRLLSFDDAREQCTGPDCDERIDLPGFVHCGWHSQLVDEHDAGVHDDEPHAGDCPAC